MPTVRCCSLLRLAVARGPTHSLRAATLSRVFFKPSPAFHAFASQNDRPTNTSPKLCPSCSKPFRSSLPICTNCWTIFGPHPDVTHHELFGLPYEPNPFVIDLATLKQRFRRAQAVIHPDAWISKGEHKHDLAQAISARVNESYRILLQPLPRAEYLLDQNDMSISEDEQEPDMSLMMEIMESRELIDDAEESSEVIKLMEENDEKLKKTVHLIEMLVAQRAWDAVKAATIRLRYLQGISRAAQKWLDEHRVS